MGGSHLGARATVLVHLRVPGRFAGFCPLADGQTLRDRGRERPPHEPTEPPPPSVCSSQPSPSRCSAQPAGGGSDDARRRGPALRPGRVGRGPRGEAGGPGQLGDLVQGVRRGCCGLQEFSSSEDAKGLEVVAVNLDAASVDDEIDAKIERHGLSTQLWRDRRNEFKRVLGVPRRRCCSIVTERWRRPSPAVDWTAPRSAPHSGIRSS